jgi:mono/diheme cytochrome c family protein
MTRTLIGSGIVAFLMGIGCAAPVGINFTGGTGGGSTGSNTGGSTGTGTIGGDSGLPCDVSAILSAHCISCHGSTPTAGAIGTMLTYDELAAPSQEVPGMSVAALGLQRMQAAASPMPPKPIPAVSAAEIASWAAWVNGGLPKGTCGGVDAGPPDTTFDGPSTCTSGQFFSGGSDGTGSSMYPGRACNACHAQSGGEAPMFAAAGTVFDLGHVPNNCLPTAAQSADLTQAQVVIHDANGVDHTLTVNSNGNFRSKGSIPYPYTAKVVYMGKERAMATPQSDGDCNGCHTDKGTSTIQGGPPAPGRVALPQ